jgi:hypothetical protein
MSVPRHSVRWWLHGMGMPLPARLVVGLISLLVLAVDQRWWIDVPVFVLLFSCLPSTIELVRRATGTWRDGE